MTDLHEPQRTFNRRDADAARRVTGGNFTGVGDGEYAAPPVAPPAPPPGVPQDKELGGHAAKRGPGRPAPLLNNPIRREPTR